MGIANNQLVTVVLENVWSIDGDVIATTASEFSTNLSPMYSSPSRVRKIAGSYLSDISDDVLNLLILKFSLEADCLATCDTNAYNKWEFYTEKWVSNNVALLAIYNSPVFLGESGGKTYKKLGDFSISRDSSSDSSGAGPAKSLISKLECEIFKVEVSVRFCREPLLDCEGASADASLLYDPSPAQTVVKGGSLARPIFGRTFAKHGNTPSWTGWLTKNNRKYLTNYSDQGHRRYWEE